MRLREAAQRPLLAPARNVGQKGEWNDLKRRAEVPIAVSTVHKSVDEEGASGTGVAPVSTGKINRVKVFSVTKRRDRELLGEAVTAWLAGNSDVRVLKTVVTLSSDSAFHCMSIVLFCTRV